MKTFYKLKSNIISFQIVQIAHADENVEVTFYYRIPRFHRRQTRTVVLQGTSGGGP